MKRVGRLMVRRHFTERRSPILRFQIDVDDEEGCLQEGVQKEILCIP